MTGTKTEKDNATLADMPKFWPTIHLVIEKKHYILHSNFHREQQVSVYIHKAVESKPR